MLLSFATISLFIFCIGTRSGETIIESAEKLKQALDDLTAAFLKLLERMIIKCKYSINIQLITFLKAVLSSKKKRRMTKN